MKNFIKTLIKDIQVDLTQEFDRNFERKAFFNEKWKKTKFNYNNGSLLQRTGKLRGSITATIEGNSIQFKSNMPYAKIHNEGGTITVTPEMKRYFWAMYIKGGRSKNKSQKQSMLKAMALKKVGSQIKIEKRQFIALNHPKVDKLIKENIDYNMQELNKQIMEKMKN